MTNWQQGGWNSQGGQPGGGQQGGGWQGGWQGGGGQGGRGGRGGGAVAHANVEDRASFLTKTYLHLVGALFVFLFLEAALIASGLAERLLYMAQGRFSWFLFLGGFMAVSYVADRWARSDTSRGMQYAGLGLYTLAEAVLFAPLVVMAMYIAVEDGEMAFSILGKALWISLVLFAGLTGVVFLTRKDFSWLRGVLMFGGLSALVLIGASLIFGFQLGLVFMWAMVVFAGASILYNTSNVLHHYRTDQYVAAALNLFASFALLLWYVLSILMSRRD
ncbi:MAG: US12 family protein [Sandaracinus sp.]|nr:US12 family protein [Sandaracinus sp.]MCB9620431.1 US12 family protein [Sandaracinus sp.]MCB9635472.1 US12 family protein [Sandaracinus sp.]